MERTDPSAPPFSAAIAEPFPSVRRPLEAALSRPWAIPLGLAIVAFAVFAPALQNRFVEWDDYINLFQNAHYRGLGWTQIRWMFTSTLMGHYIPVTWLTFGLDYTIWGMRPLGYHLTNNLIHSANTALVYLVALRLLSRATALSGWSLRLGSAFAALFFAVHPLRAESVAWATERRDVLSGCFFLLTILAYVSAVDAAGARRQWLRAASLATFALALLSKSIVMALPVVLVLLDFYPLARLDGRWRTWRFPPARNVLLEKVPYLLLGAAGAAASYYAVAANDFLTPVGRYDLSARIGISAYGLWFYLERTLVPIALSPLHELPIAVSLADPGFLLPMLGVLAITAALLTLRRRWPAGLAAWMYYGLILAPVVGIVHAGHQLTHDRYSYLSCLGFAMLVGAAVGRVGDAASRGQIRTSIARGTAAVAAAWLLALSMLTWYQVQIWRDTETLWRYAVEAEPECSICHSNLGLALMRQNLFALAKERFETALRLRPDRTSWYGGLALAYQGMGDFKSATAHYRLALAVRPDDPEALTNMAVGLIYQGRRDEALAPLEHAYRVNPSFVPTLINLAVVNIENGKPEQAITYLERARGLHPDEPMVYLNLARADLALARYVDAYHDYEALLRLDPQAAARLDAAMFSLW